MKKSHILLGSGLILLLSLTLFIVFGLQILNDSSLNGEVIEREAPDFSLTDQYGDTYNLAEHKGDKIFLLNFGYTSCPDVCPTTLATLRGVLEKLGEKRSDVEVLFISVDPERDTVEKLRNYMSYFSEDMKGLTGKPEKIEQVTNAYRVFYFKEEVKSDTEYLMSHSPSVYLIDKNGSLYLKYPQNKINAELIASDIRKLI